MQEKLMGPRLSYSLEGIWPHSAMDQFFILQNILLIPPTLPENNNFLLYLLFLTEIDLALVCHFCIDLAHGDETKTCRTLSCFWRTIHLY